MYGIYDDNTVAVAGGCRVVVEVCSPGNNINPYLPGGLFDSYQFDDSIIKFRVYHIYSNKCPLSDECPLSLFMGIK